MKKLSAVIFLLLISCAHTPVTLDSGKSSNEGRLLTQDQAQERALNISALSYKLKFDIGDTQNEFTGQNEMHFNLADPSKALRIDFQDGKIKSLRVNGTEFQNYAYNNLFIEIPSNTFVHGLNILKIEYSHPYGNNGVGLHRFKDPEDGQIYLYTNFEPFDAHRFFPCFDQPDLKAKYTMTVSSPAKWSVISTMKEDESHDENNKRVWSFPETPPISSYLFSLHAGPYKVWTSQAGSIPLRLFARQALAKYIVPQEWFYPTIAGLDFYGKYFGISYPFKKYDQIVAPDFNAGAMENVAAVTFSESYIKRGKSTAEDRERLGSVILHEMAHMWFGDLVTMKWWNGLWLNESFATFMSALALQHGTIYKRSFESLYLEDKLWAYFEDQLHTTHPIEAKVPDTDQAFANFDGITYGKGAAALKQLSFFIGEDQFREGVRQYFQKYKYGNATLADFIGALQAHSKEDLRKWSREWLETTGLNTLEVQTQCSGAQLQSVKIFQGATEESFSNGAPFLRHHRTNVGLYKDEGQNLKLDKRFSIKYSQGHTEEKRVSLCPAFVFPNVDDEDYASVILKPRDVETLSTKLKSIESTYDRNLLYQSLWDLVRMQKLKVQDYIKIVLANLDTEKDLKVLGHVANTFYGGRAKSPSAFEYAAKTPNYVELQSQVENLVFRKLKTASKKSDLQKRLFDFYVAIVQTPEGQKNILQILKGEPVLKGFELDQDRRWDVIRALSAVGHPQALELITEEKVKDASHAGVLMATMAESSNQDLKIKRKWFDQILHNKEMPFAQKRAAMRSMFSWSQEDLKVPLADLFYSHVESVAKSEEEEFQHAYSAYLVPTTCTLESSVRLEKFIHDHLDLPPAISKNLRNALQEDQRCVKARAMSLS